ncbi:MAG: winged helix-turn-helix transcriptional regulator [Porphyrobacter sp.]|nr:winged helix-turn-helix transcriptional regulator [Porphyrobacter sp.]
MVKSALPSAGEVRAFAHQLLSWAEQLASMPRVGCVLAEADRHELVLAMASAARAIARLRARIFPDFGFANPAWEILLEIFVREANGYRVSLEQLEVEDDLPALTVRRHVNFLIDRGLVERVGSASDERGVRLSLSLVGVRKMTELLLASAEHARPRSPAEDVRTSEPHPR